MFGSGQLRSRADVGGGPAEAVTRVGVGAVAHEVRRGGRRSGWQALTRENIGETERGTAEPPALRGLRAPRVPLPRERYYPFSFSGAELPGTGTGAFILPS